MWDTGAAVAVVPKSTILYTGTAWIQEPDIEFVMADGARHTPLGFAPKFVFRIGDLYFVLKVYVVEGANYQLLLGNSFIYDVGAALFPRWQKVVLSIPVKLEIQASLEPIRRDTCAPLTDEAAEAQVVVHRLDSSTSVDSVKPSLTEIHGPKIEVVQDDNIVESRDPVTVTYVGVVAAPAPPILHISSAASHAYRLGMKNLVKEVESMIVDVVDHSLPVLTCEFVESSIEFAPLVLLNVRAVVCQDIIEYSHAFSWNAFDLGCIPIGWSEWTNLRQFIPPVVIFTPLLRMPSSTRNMTRILRWVYFSLPLLSAKIEHS